MKAKKNIFSEYPETWMCLRYDGRRKSYYLNMSKEEFAAAQEKNEARRRSKYTMPTRMEKILSDLAFFANIPYEYEGDGLDDFNKYQRPASNGIGWVAICPGERGNNYYVEDPITVAILKKNITNISTHKINKQSK